MPDFYPKLQEYISDLIEEYDQISEERRSLWKSFASYCDKQIKNGNPINAIVICTHNSRRSHIGQLWLQAAGRYYNIPNVQSYSGGTEGTAFNPRAVKAMRSAGFSISKKTEGANPRYLATMHGEDDGQLLFSKCYDAPPNPKSDFGAIMVCTEADVACPIIRGADQRFAIPYHDPKAFDGTPQEEAAYAERCRDIGREVFYAMSLIGQG